MRFRERTKNEIALKELRSLNRTMKTGQISCMDCGSTHIAYESADSEFSFDISTAKMQKTDFGFRSGKNRYL